MIRRPSDTVAVAKVLFFVWLFFTVICLMAGIPWQLPVFVVGGGVVVALPFVFILRFVPAQERAVAAATGAAAKELEQLNEYERAGFQVRRRFVRGYVVSGVLAGIAFTHYRTLGGRYHPPSTVVAIATNAAGEFDVRSDRGFDSRYRFVGKTVEYDTLLTDTGNVERLAAIFGEGCFGVRKAGRILSAVKTEQQFWPIERLEAMVKPLADLRLPAPVPGAEDDRLRGFRSFYVVAAATLAIFIVGFACLFMTRPLLDGRIQFALDQAVLLGVLLLAMVAASLLLTRGHPLAARQSLVLMLALAVPVGIGLVGLLAFLNEKRDSSEAQDHIAHVLGRSEDTYRGQPLYYLQLESWRGRPAERMEVNAADYTSSTPGSIWRIRTHEGWLRGEWIESAQLETTASRP